MVCRSMYISDPRISFENNDRRVVIQIDYGTIVQQDGRVPQDEQFDFAQCLINSINQEKITEALKEKNICNFTKFRGFSAKIFDSDKPDPYCYGSMVKTLEISVDYSLDEDPFAAAAKLLKHSFDCNVVKNAVCQIGTRFYN